MNAAHALTPGSFTIDVEFPNQSQRGRYSMDVHLFWPGSGPQYPRTSLTPVFVE